MNALTSVMDTPEYAAFNSIGIIVGIVFYVIVVIALWKVFTKAGYAGWLSIIPIVNAFVLVKIAGYSAWMTLLYLIPIVNVIFHIFVALRIGKGFGQSTVFSVFLLWLFSVIGYLIIGYGSATYDKARVMD